MVLNATENVSNVSIEVTFVQRTLWLLNTFYNQVLAMLSCLLFWLIFENYGIDKPFFWHIVLSSMAYVPLMAAAIILFSEDNMWSLYIRRTKRYWIHGALLTLSCLAVSIGILLEYSASHRGHFKTTHSKLGLASWILVFIAVVFGLVAAKSRTFSAFIKPVVAKLIHNILGISAFAIGIGSLYLEMDIIKRFVSENAYIASIWALWFITAWSLLAAFKSLWGQLKSVFS